MTTAKVEQIERDFVVGVLNHYKHRGQTNWYFRRGRPASSTTSDPTWLCIGGHEVLTLLDARAVARVYVTANQGRR